jgi:hypothetical protein
VATVLVILNALIAIPKIGALIEQFIAQITAWYVQKQNNATLAQIADACNVSINAKTDEDRYAAAAAWQKALSNARVTAS